MASRLTDRPGRGVAGPSLRLGSTTSVPALLAKIVGLGAALGIGVSLTPLLIAGAQWGFLIGMWLGIAGLFLTYATKRLIPLKYLLPGTLLLTLFIVVPIAQTVLLSFTNSGDGTRGTKEQTIQTIVGNSVTQAPDSRLFDLTVGTTGSASTGPFVFFLVDPSTSDVLVGDAEGLEPVSASDVTVTDGYVRAADGYTILTGKEVNDAGAAITTFAVPTDSGAIRSLGINQAFEGVTNISYDAATDTLNNASTGQAYTVQTFGDREYFADANGVRAFDQSWEANVGFANYARLFSDEQLRSTLLGSFVWTLVFAIVSVATTFLLGLLLAVSLNDRRMRGLKIYRAVLIIPYAIPVFISFLVWQSFFNRDFGLINSFLGGASIDWLGDPTLAKIAILLTNLWVGFPYMFLVCTGALQSLPQDISEAAKIDGAGPVSGFVRIQFPLLLVAVAPLLVSSFAFNFNNFNVIQLVTGGGPFPASGGQIGATDILISGAYRIAFGGAGAEYGFAAAISTVLFIVTAVLAGIQFRYTKALEDVR
ncbi:ABC transporter permease subunit [Rathayibacter caricis]|uniref:ABC transporter permease subunit n=1 Tax=Rathayibacter caricis TaxID=110936 RepID=UPI001FB23031|nr:ABC transporter permease subunit [Rathayibacter caricis]MCJ1697996.1 ABC transporter permease subunit [Rathayibacter caricis]